METTGSTSEKIQTWEEEEKQAQDLSVRNTHIKQRKEGGPEEHREGEPKGLPAPSTDYELLEARAVPYIFVFLSA